MYSGLPATVVCTNDMVAKGVYSAAVQAGLEIGRDLGIIGYDDSSICTSLDIELTSVRYPKYETGQKAAQILLQVLNEKVWNPEQVEFLSPSLVVRQSCKRTND